MDAIFVLSSTINIEVIACEGISTRIIHSITTRDVIAAAGADVAGVVAGHLSTGNINLIICGGTRCQAGNGYRH